MKLFAGNARRAVSVFFLGAALLMVVMGLTLLSSHLAGIGFFIYWLICFLLTGFAALTALMDMLLLKRELRDEQRKLIETTLRDAKLESEKPDESPPEK